MSANTILEERENVPAHKSYSNPNKWSPKFEGNTFTHVELCGPPQLSQVPLADHHSVEWLYYSSPIQLCCKNLSCEQIFHTQNTSGHVGCTAHPLSTVVSPTNLFVTTGLRAEYTPCHMGLITCSSTLGNTKYFFCP